MESTELGNLLAASPFLADCPLMPGEATLRRFRAGQILGDRLDGIPVVGLVISGRVEVYSVALDGKDVLLSTLTAGECFGICNLLADTELETVLRCAQDTDILYIQKAALLRHLQQDAALALRYAALCNQKLQFLIQRIELLTMQSCRGRIAAFLLEREDAAGQVELVGSREDLARQLGVSRAALFRELSALQAMGVLQARGNRLAVLDRDRLEKLF